MIRRNAKQIAALLRRIEALEAEGLTLVAIARRLRMSRGAVAGFLHRQRGPRSAQPRQDDDEQPAAWVSEIPPPTLAQLMGRR